MLSVPPGRRKMSFPPKSDSAFFVGLRRDNNVTVPDNAMNHGNPNLFCLPPGWDDIALFFLANYFAHAATVVITSGSGIVGIGYAMLKALLFPTATANYGFDAITSCAIFAVSDVEKAVRAGAVFEPRDPNNGHPDVLYHSATAQTKRKSQST